MDATAKGASELEELTLAKMSKVLGPERARELLSSLCVELELELRTAQDLMRLSERMTAMGGFEGAVGAMLGVAAVLRGASRS